MVNKVVLVGRLGADAKKTEIGKDRITKISFSLCTTHYSNKTPVPSWHNCGLVGKLAESIGQYMTKGKMVYIEGRLSYWKNKEDQIVTEIDVQEVKLLEHKKDDETAAS